MAAARIGNAGLGCDPLRNRVGLAFALTVQLALVSWLGAAQDPRSAAQDPAPAPAPAPGNPSARLGAEKQDKLGRWNAGADDWESESLNLAAQQQLDALVQTWKPGLAVEAEALASLLAPGFSSTALRPTKLEAVFDDGVFLVRRAFPTSSEEEKVAPKIAGLQGFCASMEKLSHPFQSAEGYFAKFKIFTIEEDDGVLITGAFYFAEGAAPRGRIQQKATWTCTWILQSDGAPLLSSIRVDRFEEVYRVANGEPQFADNTESMFEGEDIYRTQLLQSMNYWQGRIASGLGFSDQSHQGVAIGDVNGDGLEDLYLPQPGGLPNRLFLHQPDGTLLDHSAAAGVDFLEGTRSALLLDLDNDGDLDLVMNVGADLAFLSNDGSGRFTIEISGHVPETTSLTAADYDGDGFLDIYVCRYLNPYEDQAVPTPYHDANNGLHNILLRFTGDWEIQDVTESVGLDVNNQRFSFAASWEDYDNDGDQDLYVANDFGRNNLYRNDGGSFTDVAAESGVEDISAGMGVSWGDFDRDGLMDLYVSNMYSSAGNRIAYQSGFHSDTGEKPLVDVRQHARGNSLFRNLGDGSFRDVTFDQSVHRGRWAWGSVFVDINNDAWPDLVVPNGFVTNHRDDDL